MFMKKIKEFMNNVKKFIVKQKSKESFQKSDVIISILWTCSNREIESNRKSNRAIENRLGEKTLLEENLLLFMT